MTEINHISWSKELETGIPEIDSQHRQIIDYINQLIDSRKNGDRGGIKQVIGELIEYTVSHFAFEESLMERAEYAYIAPHKRIHRLFEKRVKEYANRFAKKEEVSEEYQIAFVLVLSQRVHRKIVTSRPCFTSNCFSLSTTHLWWPWRHRIFPLCFCWRERFLKGSMSAMETVWRFDKVLTILPLKLG